MNKTKGSLLLVAVVAMVFTFSCGGDDGGEDGMDSKLVTGSGEAWVQCGVDGECGGVIFRSDGRTYGIYKENGTWYLGDGGTWSTNGNQLTITTDGSVTYTETYSVSGNKLTLIVGGHSYTYTKTSGLTIEGNL